MTEQSLVATKRARLTEIGSLYNAVGGGLLIDHVSV